ncbi:hypothetical protein CRENBAI_010990 [Crenichthys baileyi]|uniref:Uncharacterized protein n=1 Tax=Crenichthys baileyi TaxID=28760 RepID=A0AAV9R0K0_9TELE
MLNVTLWQLGQLISTRCALLQCIINGREANLWADQLLLLCAPGSLITRRLQQTRIFRSSFHGWQPQGSSSPTASVQPVRPLMLSSPPPLLTAPLLSINQLQATTRTSPSGLPLILPGVQLQQQPVSLLHFLTILSPAHLFLSSLVISLTCVPRKPARIKIS